MTAILPIGTRVRSYDFRKDKACYVEGVIDGYGGEVFPSDSHYRIKVDKRVWCGVEDVDVDPREAVVYPPFVAIFGEILVEKIL